MEPFGLIDPIVFDTKKQDRFVESYQEAAIAGSPVRQELLNHMDNLGNNTRLEVMDTFIARLGIIYSETWMYKTIDLTRQFIALYSENKEQTDKRMAIVRLLQ